MLRQEKGITLVALIVTIIILIILAGVSIASLTGEHGALTEAQNAKLLNSYNGAYDQVNMAFTSIREKVMVESVRNSDYDAREEKSIKGFMETMKGDLPEKNGFTFAVDMDNKVEIQDENTTKQVPAPAIYIKYSDKSLKEGIIDPGVKDDASKPAQPRQNGIVYTKIIVREQSVSYEFNAEKPTKTDGTEFDFVHDINVGA